MKKNNPNVNNAIIQSDSAQCYQKSILLYGLMCLNALSPIKISRFIHTETQDSKFSIDAHFAMEMGHVTRYVNMGNNVISPSQLVTALN